MARLSRAARKAVTREALIDAAARVIQREGFRVSLDEIAAEAGLTKGAIYANFENREALIREVAERIAAGPRLPMPFDERPLSDRLEEFGHRVSEAVDRDPAAFIRGLDYFLTVLENPALRADVAARKKTELGREALRERELPLPPKQYEAVQNAVGMGLALYRLMYGPEVAPASLFAWVYRRLAGDPSDIRS